MRTRFRFAVLSHFRHRTEVKWRGSVAFQYFSFEIVSWSFAPKLLDGAQEDHATDYGILPISSCIPTT